MNIMKNNKIQLTTTAVCFLALAAALNLVGGFIALSLRLPIYLDSIGTMLAAALLGPLCGMIPGLVSGLVSGAIIGVIGGELCRRLQKILI